jgi:hypothetical protein
MSDAFIPDSEAIRKALSDASEVEGTVVSFSDSGMVPQAFALVEVTHKQTVIVPVERLRLVGSGT